MGYILFVVYAICFCWLIAKSRFCLSSDLPAKALILLFCLRILSLIVSCYVNIYVLPISDSLQIHKGALEEYHLLFSNPHEYFVNIFQSHYPSGYGRLLDDSKSYWNNLRTNLMIKMVSVLDLFSFKNFWTNTLIYNFFVFFGNVALHKVFVKIFPANRVLLILCIFIFPSMLFYTSMIGKDGLTLLCLSMLVYCLYPMARYRHYTIVKLLVVVFFIILVFFLRNFVVIILLPALLAWIISEHLRAKPFLVFVLVYAISAALFFASGRISPRADLPSYVTARQKSFMELAKNANSAMRSDTLGPNLKSFLSNAPQAFDRAFLRPYIWQKVSLQYLPFAIETFCIETLFILFVFFRRKKKAEPVVWFGIFFSMSMLLVAGYTVPILGALVRYRSIYLVFLLIPIVCYTDWDRIRSLIRTGKKNI